MSDRKDIIDKANELGLEFAKNVKTSTLESMIAEKEGKPAPLDEIAPSGPSEKVDIVQQVPKQINRQKFLADQKEKAFKKQVVTLTNKDSRENTVMTTAYLSFENQFYGISRIVPLDIPVELETALIKIAESITITLHKDEIINGQRTGNKVPVTVKKFAISYAKNQV